MCSQCVHNVFTMCAQCVHNVCTMCSQCVHNVFTMCAQCGTWVYLIEGILYFFIERGCDIYDSLHAQHQLPLADTITVVH